jgi:hypothetical protein
MRHTLRILTLLALIVLNITAKLMAVPCCTHSIACLSFVESELEFETSMKLLQMSIDTTRQKSLCVKSQSSVAERRYITSQMNTGQKVQKKTWFKRFGSVQEARARQVGTYTEVIVTIKNKSKDTIVIRPLEYCLRYLEITYPSSPFLGILALHRQGTSSMTLSVPYAGDTCGWRFFVIAPQESFSIHLSIDREDAKIKHYFHSNDLVDVMIPHWKKRDLSTLRCESLIMNSHTSIEATSKPDVDYARFYSHDSTVRRSCLDYYTATQIAYLSRGYITATILWP